MTQIYELLHRDHDKVKDALTKMLDTSNGAAKTRGQMFAKVKSDLELHTKFEEEEFYPTFRKAKGDGEAKKG